MDLQGSETNVGIQLSMKSFGTIWIYKGVKLPVWNAYVILPLELYGFTRE